MDQMASDLEDEAIGGSDIDKRLADLRKEVSTISFAFSPIRFISV